jgi:hypothetical protein
MSPQNARLDGCCSVQWRAREGGGGGDDDWRIGWSGGQARVNRLTTATEGGNCDLNSSEAREVNSRRPTSG